MIHDGMPYDPIQGQDQGHGGLKYPKMADFKGYLIHQYACNQNTNGMILQDHTWILSGQIFHIQYSVGVA